MSQFNASIYSVERTSGVCAFTERVFEPHEHYYAALVEEGEELRRVDISPEAWEEGKRPEHMFSYWKAVVPEPNAKKKIFVDNGVLLNLLDRLADAEQPQRIAFRFVLTLILMRKKMLRYDKTEKRLAMVAPYVAPVLEPVSDSSETDEADEVAENEEVVEALDVESTEVASEEKDIEVSESESEELQAVEAVEVEEVAEVVVAPEPMEVMQEWWQLTPKLDYTRGPMSKWDPEKSVEVLDPHLDEEGIRQVTDQLSEILDSEL